MDDGLIESDDLLEMSQWHAEEKIRSIQAEMTTLRTRYRQYAELLDKWNAHHNAIVRARETMVCATESEEPTQINKLKVYNAN